MQREKENLCQRQKVPPPHFPLPPRTFPFTPRFLRRENTERAVRILKERCQREEGRSKVAKHQRRGMKINVEGWSEKIRDNTKFKLHTKGWER